MTPPLLHLSDIHCKCFPHPRNYHGKQNGAMNERTNEGVYLDY